jgi:hypothetical protein
MLLAKAESTNSEHEAAALWEAAQKLMIRHAIDESMLPTGDQKRESIVTRTVSLNPRDEIFSAKALLWNAIAKANRCRAYQSKWAGELSVVGYESDTVFVELLFASVMMQYATARNRGWKEYKANPFATQSRYLWVNAFAQGYALRIGERLKGQSRDEGAATGQELVLRDRAKDVDDYVDANLKLGKGRTIALRVGHGHAAGRDAANAANLTGGRNNLAGASRRQVGS